MVSRSVLWLWQLWLFRIWHELGSGVGEKHVCRHRGGLVGTAVALQRRPGQHSSLWSEHRHCADRSSSDALSGGRSCASLAADVRNARCVSSCQAHMLSRCFQQVCMVVWHVHVVALHCCFHTICTYMRLFFFHLVLFFSASQWLAVSSPSCLVFICQMLFIQCLVELVEVMQVPLEHIQADNQLT